MLEFEEGGINIPRGHKIMTRGRVQEGHVHENKISDVHISYK